MSKVTVSEAKEFFFEASLSVIAGSAAALLIPASALSRIDEMLVTFLSIVVAAVIPGVALTASAQRPPTESVRGANDLGEGLKSQVRFWFGFLYVGGFTVIILCVCRSLNWILVTPRMPWVPDYIPLGSAWLVFISATFLWFSVSRIRHVARAVRELIDLGTAAHAAAAEERRRQIQNEVEEALKAIPKNPERGAVITRGRRDA